MNTMLQNKIETWEDFADIVRQSSAHLPDQYRDRIEFELYELNKQGLNGLWVEYYNNSAKFDSNPNNLLIPWVLGMLLDASDPMVNRSSPLLISTNYDVVAKYVEDYGQLPHDFQKDSDVPDIDIDCLPIARDPIKDYAIKRYGDGDSLSDLQVCSVGTWQTYKFKMAIQDAATALGYMNRKDAEFVTSNLPDDLDNLKTGGFATCKGTVTDASGKQRECGNKHNRSVCPLCGSEITDAPTLERLLRENEELTKFARLYPAAIGFAAKMVGRIRNMGMHAGALIIANKKLLGNIPLGKTKIGGPWISLWSEGSNQQLSKCGYIKWDILGLKTLEYIYNTCYMIMNNRGIKFGIPTEIEGYGGCYDLSGLDEVDPEVGYCGKFYDLNGNEHEMRYDDPHVYELINTQRTDTIFQFDTSLAKSILADASEGQGVNDPHILTLLNACGHPGPMAMIPKALENRDDVTESWKVDLRNIHPIMEEILSPTLGIIVFQEQLTALWQRLGGFSATEAQSARKDIAKKRVDKVKKIRERWIVGASKTIGSDIAIKYFDEVMEPFGRYAFNRSHGIAYAAIIAYRCLWFKAHFFPEWISSVLSTCDPTKAPRYISMARNEGWKPTDVTKLGRPPASGYEDFDIIPVDINNLNPNFSVIGNVVSVGMLSIKGLGEANRDIAESKATYESLDDFIEKTNAGKSVAERLIKLGAFAKLNDHKNRRALWNYYAYRYKKFTSAERREMYPLLLQAAGWTPEKIEEERDRQVDAYRELYPKKKEVNYPKKVTEWAPDDSYLTLEVFNKMYDDYKVSEIIEFEEEYLGYHLSNPLLMYDTRANRTIEGCVEDCVLGEPAFLECIINEVNRGVTSKGDAYCRLNVTDGRATTTVFIWSNNLDVINPALLRKNVAVMIPVSYQPKRKSFTMRRDTNIIPLNRKD